MDSVSTLSRIKAVSFDLDDTFWDCAPVIKKAEQALSAWLHDQHPDVMALHSVESLRNRRLAMYESHAHLACDVTEMRKAFLRSLFTTPGMEYRAEIHETHVEQAFAVFYRARSEVVLYEGTRELLDTLSPTHKLAAITNGNADLELIGLDAYFDDIQSASLKKPPKPAADMFQSCCRNLDVNPSELLHVGDNPETDIVGGHNANVHTVWFNQFSADWPAELPRPHFEVSSLPELQQLLGGSA